jgi:hypothetical protein
MEKKIYLENKLEKFVNRELKALKDGYLHPFIQKVEFAFQTNQYLYLGLDVHKGGDF